MNAHVSGGPERIAAPPVDVGLEDVRAQVQRILTSSTFRAAEALRRLFRFLAEKTFAGEADHLKEYSVGLDVLGKPPTFDPAKDAIVRLQASRLRQKLEDYYRDEGRLDPLVIEVPKGRFKIVWRRAILEFSPPPEPVPAVLSVHSPDAASLQPESNELRRWRLAAVSFGLLSVVVIVFSFWAFFRTAPASSVAARIAGTTSPQLEELWKPFLTSSHHLILGFSNPFFVRLQESGYRDIIYHTMDVNSWDDAKGSPELSALTRALGKPKTTPTFNMVERSTLLATFTLSRFLATRLADITLARSVDVSWQQLADNDVILFASLSLDQGNSALPVQPAFITDKEGVRNLEPRNGEPQVYPDARDHQESDGQGLELISMLPGPLGRTNVMTFSSNHAWGIICGVRALTDPSFARTLVEKLKTPGGRIPPYYQVVLKINYRDGTPTKAEYITHRVLPLK